MAQYNYRIITPAGKEKKGTLQAKSRDAAMTMLKNEKNVVVQCDEATTLTAPFAVLHKGQKVKPRDLALFCHQSHPSTMPVLALSKPSVCLLIRPRTKPFRMPSMLFILISEKVKLSQRP